MTTTDTTHPTPAAQHHLDRQRTEGMVERGSLRLAATLLAIGDLVFIVSGLFHPSHYQANDHSAVFAEYAASGRWNIVHIGQFVGMTVMLGGLIALVRALNIREGSRGWAARFVAITAAVTIALYGVLQAIDGVALKQAVDAWVSAPTDEKAAAFRAAEAIRWLEWGVRSFQQFMLGLSLLLLAGLIASTRRLPRTTGYLAAVSGLAYIAQGYVLSAEGFSEHGNAPGLLALAFGLAWIIWLAVTVWRTNEPVGSRASTGTSSSPQRGAHV